jgi:hypothetical protein
MTTRDRSTQAWREVRARIVRTGGTITLPKTQLVPHPRDAGVQLAANLALGQIAEYLLDLEIGTAPLVVREFVDHYEAFLGDVRLAQEMLSLVEANPAAAPWLVGALLGAAVGTAIAKNGEGAWIGAGVGLLLASFLVTVKDQKSYAPAL